MSFFRLQICCLSQHCALFAEKSNSVMKDPAVPLLQKLPVIFPVANLRQRIPGPGLQLSIGVTDLQFQDNGSLRHVHMTDQNIRPAVSLNQPEMVFS